jgi:hypothetical protein
VKLADHVGADPARGREGPEHVGGPGASRRWLATDPDGHAAPQKDGGYPIWTLVSSRRPLHSLSPGTLDPNSSAVSRAWWHMDDERATMSDVSSYGNTGQLTSALVGQPRCSMGRHSGSTPTHGLDSYVTVPDNDSLSAVSVIAMWMAARSASPRQWAGSRTTRIPCCRDSPHEQSGRTDHDGGTAHGSTH